MKLVWIWIDTWYSLYWTVSPHYAPCFLHDYLRMQSMQRVTSGSSARHLRDPWPQTCPAPRSQAHQITGPVGGECLCRGCDHKQEEGDRHRPAWLDFFPSFYGDCSTNLWIPLLWKDARTQTKPQVWQVPIKMSHNHYHVILRVCVCVCMHWQAWAGFQSPCWVSGMLHLCNVTASAIVLCVSAEQHCSVSAS